MFKSLMPNIMTESIEETIEFYTKKLSFTVVEKVEPEEGKAVFVIFSKDNCLLSFQEKSSLIEEYNTLKTSQIKPTFTLFFKVENVDELYRNLSVDITIASELHETFYGTKEFAIFDNNGNILTLAGE